MEKNFHLISYTAGLASFVAIYLMIRPRLVAAGTRTHLTVLIAINFFRYFGLTALLPGVFNLKPAGFSESFLRQVAWGDFLVSILALITFAILYTDRPYAITAVWIFNIIGMLDYLNAAARVTPKIADANLVGPFGWYIMTVFLPAWLVSHLAIFHVLATRKTDNVRTTKA
jgi:hypothetical protein